MSSAVDGGAAGGGGGERTSRGSASRRGHHRQQHKQQQHQAPAAVEEPFEQEGGSGGRISAMDTGGMGGLKPQDLAGGGVVPEGTTGAGMRGHTATTPANLPSTQQDFGSRAVEHEALAALTTQGTPTKRVPAPTEGMKGVAAAFAPGPSPAHHGRWMQIGEMDKMDQEIVQALLGVVESRSMEEHVLAFGALSHDILWDAPPALLQGRDSMRAMVYWAKTIAHLTFDPMAAKVEEVDASRKRIQLEVMFHVLPLKPWWLGPAAWVLPNDIPIRATIVVGVMRDTTTTAASTSTGAGPGTSASGVSPGTISWIWGRWHNLPILPSLLRMATGLTMGKGLAATEGLWSRTLSPLHVDQSYDRLKGPGPAAARPY